MMMRMGRGGREGLGKKRRKMGRWEYWEENRRGRKEDEEGKIDQNKRRV